jgi:hypothetical protein
MNANDFKYLCSKVREYNGLVFECPSCGCRYIALRDLGICPGCYPKEEFAEMLWPEEGEVPPAPKPLKPGLLSNDTLCLHPECQRPRREHRSYYFGKNCGSSGASQFCFCPDDSGRCFEHRCKHCQKEAHLHFAANGALGGSLCTLDPCNGWKQFTYPSYDES